MIFDGLKFRRTSKVVTLPYKFWEDGNYVMFGRVAKDPNDPKAVATNWYRQTDTGTRIMVKAIPIVAEAHSRTNMMYGKDGYTYLFINGQVYIRKT